MFSVIRTKVLNMDWSMCLICQQKIKEPMKCQFNAKGDRDLSVTYNSFLTNVSAWNIASSVMILQLKN